jgi:hypothetical protein
MSERWVHPFPCRYQVVYGIRIPLANNPLRYEHKHLCHGVRSGLRLATKTITKVLCSWSDIVFSSLR